MSESPDTVELRRLGVDNEALTLLDASLDCIKLVETDGTLSFMNANGLCIMDVRNFDDIRGKLWSDLWPGDAQQLIEDAVDCALEGKAVRFEAFCPTAAGRPRWWDVSVSPVVTEGEVRRILSISRDISDRVIREQRADERERIATRRLGAPETTNPALLSRVGPVAERDLQDVEALGVADEIEPSAFDRAELRRLAKVQSLGLNGENANLRLQAAVEAVKRLLDVPTALVSIVEEDRQVFLARAGMETCETPRSQSFCSIAIQTPDWPMVIGDARSHPQTRNNPLVLKKDGIRAYLGIPLVTTDGFALGSLCAIDYRPRRFKKADVDTLRLLAEGVVARIETEGAARRARRAEIVNAELKHRMGNIYAQVSSLVGLLSQTADDKDRLAEQLRENITALSRTQARIARGDWIGLDLCSLVEDVFDATTRTRIDCDIDPNFDVAANIAFLLTLALQELATNSRKHGVLGTDSARARLEIRTDANALKLIWSEEAIKRETLQVETPRQGFGQKLLTRIVPLGLGGEAELRIGTEGAEYVLTAPRDRVETG